jgi:hypothetical protein
MALFMVLGCSYCKQTQRAFTVFKNTLNWLKIDSVDQQLFKSQLTIVWELLTRRWNAWHWERHCVFTTGSERVKRWKTEKKTQMPIKRWRRKKRLKKKKKKSKCFC